MPSALLEQNSTSQETQPASSLGRQPQCGSWSQLVWDRPWDTAALLTIALMIESRAKLSHIQCSSRGYFYKFFENFMHASLWSHPAPTLPLKLLPDPPPSPNFKELRNFFLSGLTFLVTMTDYLTRSNLREERLYSDLQCKGIQSVMPGKVGWWEEEAAGPISSAVRK